MLLSHTHIRIFPSIYWLFLQLTRKMYRLNLQKLMSIQIKNSSSCLCSFRRLLLVTLDVRKMIIFDNRCLFRKRINSIFFFSGETRIVGSVRTERKLSPIDFDFDWKFAIILQLVLKNYYGILGNTMKRHDFIIWKTDWIFGNKIK